MFKRCHFFVLFWQEIKFQIEHVLAVRAFSHRKVLTYQGTEDCVATSEKMHQCVTDRLICSLRVCRTTILCRNLLLYCILQHNRATDTLFLYTTENHLHKERGLHPESKESMHFCGARSSPIIKQVTPGIFPTDVSRMWTIPLTNAMNAVKGRSNMWDEEGILIRWGGWGWGKEGGKGERWKRKLSNGSNCKRSFVCTRDRTLKAHSAQPARCETSPGTWGHVSALFIFQSAGTPWWFCSVPLSNQVAVTCTEAPCTQDLRGDAATCKQWGECTLTRHSVIMCEGTGGSAGSGFNVSYRPQMCSGVSAKSPFNAAK